MSAIRLLCEPATGNPNIPRLDLVWDESAGTLSGDGEEWLRELMSAGSVRCHPGPGHTHTLSTDPLRSRTDMAALIGCSHRIPAELAEDYPFGPDEDIVVELLDEAGRVMGVERVLY